VNKTDLINKLAERLDGDKKTAQKAVEGVIDLVQREVQRGQKVSISGFGVFEKRARAARTARNPRTGEAVKVKKTNVPSFRAGTAFKDIVSGKLKLPKASTGVTTARALTAAARGGAAKPAAAPKAATRTAAKAAPKAAGTRTPRATAAKSTAATAAPKAAGTRTPRATAAKSTASKATTTRGTAAKAAPKAAASKPAAPRRTAAKAAPTAAAAKPAAKRATAKKK
jgi:DNA-binding protein HU-beta